MKQILLLIPVLSFYMLSFGQLNMEQLGHFPYTDQLSDIWGWVDNEGNEYALVGTYSGLSVVDVTDPAEPVEKFFGPGAESIWRDIKTWDHYAYVSNEQDGGIYIVDLSPLPEDIIDFTSFTGSSYLFSSAHNLYIDETGKLYIFGADNGNGGAIICDLTADPMNPVELGRFDDYYLHDGMARGDTLWGGAIYAGNLLAIDVSDPANTSIMGSASTPSQFTHNAWVSDDGTHVFTTDEVSSGFIGSFDVTDLSNIIETDRIQTAEGSGVIPHNVHVLNDYLITSYYTEGVTIHDASFPEYLFEVGHFDTSPNYSGNGYNGSWGAYPFLPSGNILASDMEEGLYILQPNYTRATHIAGIVTDSITGDPLFNVAWEVLFYNGQTAFDGSYSLSTLENGTYSMIFSKEGYNQKIVDDVEFVNGELTNLDVQMSIITYTGIAETSSQILVNAYPNPFSGELKVDYTLSNELNAGAKIQVYDLTGSLVNEISLSQLSGTIKLGDELIQGRYFLKISNGIDDIKTERIVKL